ncbi:hypothetical protein A1Q1_00140 [Trichosporon asahii var. asahii CBS 2479]|uniref:Uncharacterized protein n=1 Tax=Trichosporon asahii var. asahii (strain ATCC 90039 / CBS 2479 / JCM 2466 / KCTC 7840 / NBRC 103889/ NCYC 2677 / UAMH 7654) TaxID=1186058 RepID=J6F0S9_TRIAS|nr:hypothetical protein A1Q1_00140 [Trichosporon asahii var. asahii CBS 2479]EJT50519.1 hypothetical protein A1Q1_00140 [Trichosporon asahii var. asahii CBS 2479]
MADEAYHALWKLTPAPAMDTPTFVRKATVEQSDRERERERERAERHERERSEREQMQREKSEKRRKELKSTRKGRPAEDNVLRPAKSVNSLQRKKEDTPPKDTRLRAPGGEAANLPPSPFGRPHSAHAFRALDFSQLQPQPQARPRSAQALYDFTPTKAQPQARPRSAQALRDFSPAPQSHFATLPSRAAPVERTLRRSHTTIARGGIFDGPSIKPVSAHSSAQDAHLDALRSLEGSQYPFDSTWPEPSVDFPRSFEPVKPLKPFNLDQAPFTTAPVVDVSPRQCQPGEEEEGEHGPHGRLRHSRSRGLRPPRDVLQALRRGRAPSRGRRPADPSLLYPRGPGRLRRRDVRAPRQRGRDADAEAAHGAAAAQLVRAIGQSLPLPRRREHARRLRAHAEARAK